MARAATAGELASFRSDGQSTRLYISIPSPATVWTGRVNGAPTSTDHLVEITYDGGSAGTPLAGQSLWIGSSAGASDIGIARIRKTKSSTILYIGERSDLVVADNNYLTVVDERLIWPKTSKVESSRMYMDWDVAYVAQHTLLAPVPVLGPDRVLWLVGTVSTVFDASESWVPGGTITGYSWSAPGASATSGLTTATPTITYNAVGTYTVSCTVTSSFGVTAIGYRTVVVHSSLSMPATQFTIGDIVGDVSSGGWSFRVTQFAGASTSEIRDGAKIILHAIDYYGSTLGSIGPIVGLENVVCTGWISGESIVWDPESGQVDFTVTGPAWWLGQTPANDWTFHAGTPADNPGAEVPVFGFTTYPNATIDAAVWHLITWRSTISTIFDVFVSGDTRQFQALDVTGGTLWAQLQTISSTILGSPKCDRYGRLFVQIEPQLTPSASRVFPIVMEVLASDRAGTMTIESLPRRSSFYDTSGTVYSGGVLTPVYSRSSGEAPSRLGVPFSLDGLLVSSQAQLNSLTGLLAGVQNNKYPNVDFTLASNNRLIDIAPPQYVTISIQTGDTVRGISWTSKKLVPKRVTLKVDLPSGIILTAINAEAESIEEPAVTVYREAQLIDNFPDQPPMDLPDWPQGPGVGLPPTQPPGTITPPPPEEDPLCRGDAAWPPNGPFDTGIRGMCTSDGVTGTQIPFIAFFRSASWDNQTRYELAGTFEIFDPGTQEWTEDPTAYQYTIWALDSWGNVAATNIPDAISDPKKRTGTFSNPDGVEIKSLVIEIWPQSFVNPAIYKNQPRQQPPTANMRWTSVTPYPYTIEGADELTVFQWSEQVCEFYIRGEGAGDHSPYGGGYTINAGYHFALDSGVPINIHHEAAVIFEIPTSAWPDPCSKTPLGASAPINVAHGPTDSKGFDSDGADWWCRPSDVRVREMDTIYVGLPVPSGKAIVSVVHTAATGSTSPATGCNTEIIGVYTRITPLGLRRLNIDHLYISNIC